MSVYETAMAEPPGNHPYLPPGETEEDYEMVFDVLDRLAELHRELLALENRVAETDIGPRDVLFNYSLKELERNYRDIARELTNIHHAIGLRTADSLSMLAATADRQPTEKERRLYAEMWRDGAWDDQIERITRTSERVDRRLASRMESLNTRRALYVSLLAMVASVTPVWFP